MRAAFAMCLCACGRYDFARTFVDAPDAPTLPPRLVQAQQPGFVVAPTTSVAIDLTTGNVVIAALYWDESPDTVTLADTLGLAWTNVPLQELAGGCGGTTGNGTGAQLWFAHVTATASETVTVTQSMGPHPLGAFLLEYADTSGDIVATSEQVAQTSSQAMSVRSIDVPITSVIIALFNDTIGTGADAVGSGYTIQAHDDGFPSMLEGRVVAPGTYTVDAMLPQGHNDACWVGVAVALRGR